MRRDQELQAKFIQLLFDSLVITTIILRREVNGNPRFPAPLLGVISASPASKKSKR